MLVNYAGAKRAAKTYLGFDIVYTNTITSPFGGLLADRLGLPNVWQIRENLPADPPQWLVALFGRLATVAIGNSRHITSQVERWIPAERVHLVYSGPFDDEELQRPVVRAAPPGPPFELLLVGRLSPEKRQEEAVRAVKVLLNRGMDVVLTLAGTFQTDYAKQMVALAAELGISDRVRVYEDRANVRPLYECAHVNLNCTLAEPLGRTILEGMAFGCPTVAVAGGGTLEIIRNGENGLLYQAGDVEELAGCIQRLLTSPEDSKTLAAQARASVLPKFTRTRYTSDTLAVFERAMASRVA